MRFSCELVKNVFFSWCTDAEITSVTSATSLLSTKMTTTLTLFARLQLSDQPETVLGISILIITNDIFLTAVRQYCKAHRMYQMRTIAIDDPGRLSCSFMRLRCANAAGRIEILLGVEIPGGPEKRCIRRQLVPISPRIRCRLRQIT